MKKSRILLILTIITLGLLLSACSGNRFAATSWPGLTVDEDTAYLAYGPHVFAINLNSGNQRWKYPAEADTTVTFFAAPTLTGDGQLLASGYNNILYSLDPKNGNQNWTFEDATNRLIGSPLATEQGIFVPSADHNLYALDMDGKLLWEFTTDQALWAMPTANGGALYLPAMDHNFYALDMDSGRELWALDLGGAMVGAPVLNEDHSVVYVGTFGNEVLAINTSSHNVLWRFQTDGWVWSSLTLAEDRLYFGDLDGNLFAVNTGNGSLAWRIETDGIISGAPLVTEDAVYIGTEAGTLYALDLDGNPLWSKTLEESKLYGSPVAAGEYILITVIGEEALLYAFDADGNIEWQFTPEN